MLLGTCVYLGILHRSNEIKVPLLDGSTITVVPRVHLIGGLGPSVAYVVETSEGLVLIDTGLDESARSLKMKMSKLGLDPKQLRAIFLTHAHGDHCGGAERLRAETGARVHAGRADAAVIQAGGPYEAVFSTFKMPGHSPHATSVDVELQGGETASFGDTSIQVIAAPGHTDGSTCYLMERPGLRVLFSGDVIMRLGDHPLGTYSAYLAPRYRGNAKFFVTTLKTLRSMRVPDVVLPGHFDGARVPQSAQFTQQRWEQMLSDGIGEMERLIARYAADGANFLDGNPKILLPDLYYLGEFQGTAIYAFMADSKLFLVDAPGGAGLIDFLNERLRALGVARHEPFAVLLTACGPSETAGLNDLVLRYNTQVIVSSDGLKTVKKLCPPDVVLVPADALAEKGWFDSSPIPLPGPGIAAVGWLLRWKDKQVLFTGRVLGATGLSSSNVPSSPIARARPDAQFLFGSIQRLATYKPDLWLPSVPTDGQNANLYGDAWRIALEKSLRAAQ